MGQIIRKSMTMNKALRTGDDVDGQYVSRKEGERRLASIEESVDASIQRLANYIEKYGEGLITANRNDTNNTKTSKMKITRKTKVRRKKKLCRRFKRLISRISHEKNLEVAKKRKT